MAQDALLSALNTHVRPLDNNSHAVDNMVYASQYLREQYLNSFDYRNPAPITHEKKEKELNTRLREALMSRLEVWGRDWLPPNDIVLCFYNKEYDIVNIFYVFGKDSGVVEDDKHLFPSDELITTLRLLRG